MKKKIICVGTTLYRIVNRDCHYSPIRGIGRYYTVNKNTAGKILIFWWDDESIYKHKEKQQLTSSSTFQQKNLADEKRKDIPHSTSLFFGRAVWWNDDECISFWRQCIIPLNHQFIGFSSANKSAGQTDGRKCHYPQAGRSDIRPACCPTSRQGKVYHINEKKRSAYPLVLSQAFENRKAIAH